MTEEQKGKAVFVRNATGLVRQISAVEALGMSLGGIGLLFVFNVYVYTPAFYPTANPIVTPLIGALMILPIAVVYILLSAAMPRSGGDYVWASRVFSPGIGFVINFGMTVIFLSFIASSTSQVPQWAGAAMLYDLGKIYGNSGLISTASYLQGQLPTVIISAVLTIIEGLVVLVSVKLAARIVKYWLFFSAAIGLIFVITILATGQSAFVSNFNSLSGANYSHVVSLGVQAGAYPGVPPVFSTATLYAGALGLLSYLGFNYSSYFGGEVKQVKRSQIIAQLGSIGIFAIFGTIILAVEYYGEGPAFVNSMASLWISGSSSFPYVTIPIASGMSVFWTPNAALVVLFNLGYALTVIIGNIAIFFTFSRNLFAWSFDRIVPTAFADVNPRTHTPLKAILLMMIGGLAFLYVANYTFGILTSLFSYSTAGVFIVFFVVCAVAVVYPYRRRDIFSSDPNAQRKLAGVPLVTVAGVIGMLVSAFVVYSLLVPLIGANFITILLEGIIPTFIGGVIVYAIAWAVRRRQGIDLGLLQKELPPE